MSDAVRRGRTLSHSIGDVRRTALAGLIDDTEARNDWRDTTVVRQAAAAGHKLTTSDVSLFRRHGMRTLSPMKVRALAAGLKLPAYRVALAVLVDLGIDVPIEAHTPEQAVAHDHTLSAHMRDVLLALIRQDRDT